MSPQRPQAEMQRASAHQANFLPWPGFWHKLVSADVFVACVGFEFTPRGYENRVRMRDTGDWATVPVRGTRGLSYEVEIADRIAVAQIARRIDHWSRQRRYRHRDRLAPVIDYLQSNSETHLYRLNFRLIEIVLDILGHRNTQIRLDLTDRTGVPIEISIADIVTSNGEIYLSGSSGPEYAGRSAMASLQEVYVQDLPNGVASESVLHMIAECDDPLSKIRELGSWRLWHAEDVA